MSAEKGGGEGAVRGIPKKKEKKTETEGERKFTMKLGCWERDRETETAEGDHFLSLH